MIDIVAMPPFGQEIRVEPGTFKTHTVASCISPDWCVIHNPSDHAMRTWPITLRLDKDALCERRCPHGVGHPDPDSVAYYVRQLGDSRGGTLGIHSCDGCCQLPDPGYVTLY